MTVSYRVRLMLSLNLVMGVACLHAAPTLWHVEQELQADGYQSGAAAALGVDPATSQARVLCTALNGSGLRRAVVLPLNADGSAGASLCLEPVASYTETIATAISESSEWVVGYCAASGRALPTLWQVNGSESTATVVAAPGAKNQSWPYSVNNNGDVAVDQGGGAAYTRTVDGTFWEMESPEIPLFRAVAAPAMTQTGTVAGWDTATTGGITPTLWALSGTKLAAFPQGGQPRGTVRCAGSTGALYGGCVATLGAPYTEDACVWEGLATLKLVTSIHTGAQQPGTVTRIDESGIALGDNGGTSFIAMSVSGTWRSDDASSVLVRAGFSSMEVGSVVQVVGLARIAGETIVVVNNDVEANTVATAFRAVIGPEQLPVNISDWSAE